MERSLFGLVIPPSSANEIRIMGSGEAAGKAIVGKSIYTLMDLDDGQYLSIGLVTNITTFNKQAGDLTEQSIDVVHYQEAEQNRAHSKGTDVRIATVRLQATFKQLNGSATWDQHGASLPTSPSAYSHVYIMDEETVFSLIDRDEVSFLGYSHQSKTLSPFIPARFSDASGAVHSAYFAKSGSGKSVLASMNMGINMQDIHRTIITVDPQGQWSSEHGFLYSPQAFARAIGRPVEVLRVSEDIRLLPEVELVERLLTYSGLWKRFMKMSPETRDILSTELAEDMVFRSNTFELSPEEAFRRFMVELDSDHSRLNKIYASNDRRTDLRNRMRNLLQMRELDTDGQEITEYAPSPLMIERAQRDLQDLINTFSPVHNLFSKTNARGNPRHALLGEHGKLSRILVARQDSDDPAPYIIIDMSNSSADDEMAKYRSQVMDDNAQLQMNKLLGSNEVKTAILTHIFSEMTTIAEQAFNVGGNLNTEIVFDEAMRFAMPPGQAESDTAKEFTNNLAEYARDTRKFGIGWTYILQTPTGLNDNIFKQLSNFYIGWGLAGQELKKIGEQMDGSDYLSIYSSFASPRSTGVYPFMLMGSGSPLVFTHTPTFIDGFNGIEEFFANNSRWINELGTAYGKGTIRAEDVSVNVGRRQQADARKALRSQRKQAEKKAEQENPPAPKKRLSVGSNRDDVPREQTAPSSKPRNDWTVTTDEDPPF